MNTNRRLLTPVTASVVAAIVVGVATLGGAMTGDRAAPKADRFAATDKALCAGQQWPNLTNECLAWSEGTDTAGSVRFVTVAATDADAGVTTLTRTRTDASSF
jgi:hypothetical protein